MFPLKNLAHKGLLLICIWMGWMVHSHEVSWPPYETYTSSLWPGYISELGQHWFRWWLTPAQCQAITWTSADPVNWFMDLMDHKYIELKFIIYFPDKTCVYVYDVWYCSVLMYIIIIQVWCDMFFMKEFLGFNQDKAGTLMVFFEGKCFWMSWLRQFHFNRSVWMNCQIAQISNSLVIGTSQPVIAAESSGSRS